MRVVQREPSLRFNRSEAALQICTKQPSQVADIARAGMAWPVRLRHVAYASMITFNALVSAARPNVS